MGAAAVRSYLPCAGERVADRGGWTAYVRKSHCKALRPEVFLVRVCASCGSEAVRCISLWDRVRKKEERERERGAGLVGGGGVGGGVVGGTT